MPKYLNKSFKNAPIVSEYTIRQGKLNLRTLLGEGEQANLYRTNSENRPIVSGNNLVTIDTGLLMPKILSLPRYSSSIYFYLLTLLQDNREQIRVHNTELRNKSTDITLRQSFDKYLHTLACSGLIFRFRSHEFYVNPLYAWVGDRAQYLDIDRLPFKSLERQQEVNE